MNLFHRHTWELKAVQTFDMAGWAGGYWTKISPETTMYYVCSACQADRTREEVGIFNLNQAKSLFPRP